MSDLSKLEEFGCSPRWRVLYEPHIAAGLVPGRVIRTDRGSALVMTSAGVMRAKSSARLLKAAGGPADLPAVGDWVAVASPAGIDVPLIEAVLDRTSAITRGDAGKPADLQVLAANIDTVFIVHPINEPPNLRRIERELSLAWDSGVVPVVVLTKSDLSTEPDSARAAVESVALGVELILVNALEAEQVHPLLTHISGHRTAVLFGSSGAGKSTLINTLLGEQRQATREIRVRDGAGRHTTVARELFQLPGGGLMIDTPGLRMIGLTGSVEGVSSVFPEIEQAAGSCRFRDCSHNAEPGCAVQSAVVSGALPAERLASFHKLVSEARMAAMKSDARLRSEENRKWRTAHKALKTFYKRTGRE